MAPSKTAVPVEAKDLNELVDLIIDSKNNLSISMVLVKNFPDIEGRKGTTIPASKGAFEDPACTNLKVTDDQTGEIIGHIVFKRCHPEKARPKENPATEQSAEEAKPDPALEAFNKDVLNMVMEGVGKISDFSKGMERYEVVFGVVKKPYRRQGIGRILMQPLLDRSKEEGVPVIAQAEPAGYDFFKALGFKDTVGADFDLARFAPPRSGFGLFRLQGMIREP